jgi:hypothetical protein
VREQAGRFSVAAALAHEWLRPEDGEDGQGRWTPEDKRLLRELAQPKARALAA